MPAIGASTTGTASLSGPICRLAAVCRLSVVKASMVTHQFSQERLTRHDSIQGPRPSRGGCCCSRSSGWPRRASGGRQSRASSGPSWTLARQHRQDPRRESEHSGGLPSAYRFAPIPGDKQISGPKLRAVVRANELSQASPEFAFEATGNERSTIRQRDSVTARQPDLP